MVLNLNFEQCCYTKGQPISYCVYARVGSKRTLVAVCVGTGCLPAFPSLALQRPSSTIVLYLPYVQCHTTTHIVPTTLLWNMNTLHVYERPGNPGNTHIENMRVPFWPIRRAGSWGYFAGSCREATLNVIIILINIRENETIMFR